MTIKEILFQPHMANAIYHIRKAQRELAFAGLGTSPTYYKLSRARMTIERKLKGKHLEDCVCSKCLLQYMKQQAKLAT